MGEYKVIVNKDLLYEFLMCDESEMGSEHLEEVYKVIDIVIHKYYMSYISYQNDLRCSTFTTILERRDSFNPDKDAYNYIFTQARNEVGNNIYRWNRENKVEDIISWNEPGEEDADSLSTSDLPPAIIKYYHYLIGEVDFSVKRISRKDATDILVWLKIKEGKSVSSVPEFIVPTEKNVGILYKLIKDLVEEPTY